jgi:hypothetical protein
VSLGPSLVLVFFAFVALLLGVIVVAFRERKFARTAVAPTREAQQASDARVMTTIFVAIPGGMLLTLAVAYLVFAP